MVKTDGGEGVVQAVLGTEYDQHTHHVVHQTLRQRVDINLDSMHGRCVVWFVWHVMGGAIFMCVLCILCTVCAIGRPEQNLVRVSHVVVDR